MGWGHWDGLGHVGTQNLPSHIMKLMNLVIFIQDPLLIFTFHDCILELGPHLRYIPDPLEISTILGFRISLTQMYQQSYACNSSTCQISLGTDPTHFFGSLGGTELSYTPQHLNEEISRKSWAGWKMHLRLPTMASFCKVGLY